MNHPPRIHLVTEEDVRQHGSMTLFGCIKRLLWRSEDPEHNRPIFTYAEMKAEQIFCTVASLAIGAVTGVAITILWMRATYGG